jgi:hypothetical protein
MKMILIHCFALAAWALSFFDCRAMDTSAPNWSAQWIGINQASTPGSSTSEITQTNLWTCLRKEFFLSQKPKTAEARIAVDSKYWLWVNGKLAVFEGGLKRGPNPRDTYFEVVDLGPYLRKGSNTIAVLAWYWGKQGFSYNCSGKAGFVFELTAGKTKIISDEKWKATRHPAYGNMVESPYTTLWEGWGVGNGSFGGGSYNHGWCGGPLALMMEYFAGVTPVSPGFATFQVKPELGPLTRVSSVTHTVHGLIRLEIHRTTSSFELTLDSPKETFATVCLPLAQYCLRETLLNGQPVGKVSGVQALKPSDGEAGFVVGGGTWKFEAR